MHEYRMIQVPPNIQVKRAAGNEAALYLQSLASEQATQGWEFYRVDAIGVEIIPVA